MKQLSIGKDSTLGNYRTLFVALHGVHSKAVEWLDKEIEEKGANTEIKTDENEMMSFLMKL